VLFGEFASRNARISAYAAIASGYRSSSASSAARLTIEFVMIPFFIGSVFFADAIAASLRRNASSRSPTV
jgi:hypothetical protein